VACGINWNWQAYRRGGASWQVEGSQVYVVEECPYFPSKVVRDEEKYSNDDEHSAHGYGGYYAIAMFARAHVTALFLVQLISLLASSSVYCAGTAYNFFFFCQYAQGEMF
jgi:hypothetical protein